MTVYKHNDIICYQENILETCDSDEKHLQLMLEHVKERGVLNIFFQNSVEYLGQLVGHKWCTPLQRKCRLPKNISELRSYLILREVYSKNIIVHPFSTTLLGNPWVWSEERRRAFHLNYLVYHQPCSQAFPPLCILEC